MMDEKNRLIMKIKQLQNTTGIITMEKDPLDEASEEELDKIYGDEVDKKIINDVRTKTYQYLVIKQRGAATEEIVKYLENNHVFKSTRSDTNSEIWIYREGIYENNGETFIKEKTRNILGDAHSSHLINNVVEKIRADTFISVDEFFNKQNKHLDLLPLENGIINIRTKKIQPFTPDIYFFNKLPVKYDPLCSCTSIIAFLSEITEKQEDVETLQEMIGFCLLKDYTYEKAFMLYGTGRNGKSKFFELIKHLVGEENITSTNLSQLEDSNGFAVHNFHNKLVNIAAEVTNKALSDKGLFKSLVGRDSITANRKGKDYIQFKNYAKLLFATNKLPQPKSVSEAFWLRWVVIKFPMKFLPQKEIDAIPEGERQNVKLQNPELMDQLIDPFEMSGLLNWALEGLDRLRENKDFTFSKTVGILEQEWLRESNSLIAFIEDQMVVVWEGEVSKATFKRDYHDYCKKYKLRP